MVENPFQRPKAPKKGIVLFKHDKPKEDGAVSEELGSTINRLRVLEERYTNLQSEIRVIEDNMVRRNRNVTTEIKALTLDINELRKEINEIKDKVIVLVKELQRFAKREDVQVMQKYIEMWEPLNFVTHKEVEEIIDEKLALKRSAEQ